VNPISDQSDQSDQNQPTPSSNPKDLLPGETKEDAERADRAVKLGHELYEIYCSGSREQLGGPRTMRVREALMMVASLLAEILVNVPSKAERISGILRVAGAVMDLIDDLGEK